MEEFLHEETNGYNVSIVKYYVISLKGLYLIIATSQIYILKIPLTNFTFFINISYEMVPNQFVWYLLDTVKFCSPKLQFDYHNV